MRLIGIERLGLRWHFRLIPCIAMVMLVALGCSLGQWQLRRADQKNALEVKLSLRSQAPVLHLSDIKSGLEDDEFRRLKIRGHFISQWPLYLDNRPYQGRAGLYVLMPFQAEGTDRFILIQRGWLARDARDREFVPPLATPQGVVTVEGRLRRQPGRVLQLGPSSRLRPGAILQNFDPTPFTQESGLRLEPYSIEQTSASPDGLIRDWPRPSTGIARHRGYAFQWFALAAMAAVFIVVTGFKRG